jgi:hypothetical protein
MHEVLRIAALALKISIMVQIFALGLGTTWADAAYLFGKPKLLLNSILARNVAVPAIAVLLIKVFSIDGAVAIAVLSMTPVPPLLPKAQLKKGARSEYVVGLLVSQTVLAILFVPLTIQFMNWVLGRGHARSSVSAVPPKGCALFSSCGHCAVGYGRDAAPAGPLQDIRSPLWKRVSAGADNPCRWQYGRRTLPRWTRPGERHGVRPCNVGAASRHGSGDCKSKLLGTDNPGFPRCCDVSDASNDPFHSLLAQAAVCPRLSG